MLNVIGSTKPPDPSPGSKEKRIGGRGEEKKGGCKFTSIVPAAERARHTLHTISRGAGFARAVARSRSWRRGHRIHDVEGAHRTGPRVRSRHGVGVGRGRREVGHGHHEEVAESGNHRGCSSRRGRRAEEGSGDGNGPGGVENSLEVEVGRGGRSRTEGSLGYGTVEASVSENDREERRVAAIKGRGVSISSMEREFCHKRMGVGARRWGRIRTSAMHSTMAPLKSWRSNFSTAIVRSPAFSNSTKLVDIGQWMAIMVWTFGSTYPLPSRSRPISE